MCLLNDITEFDTVRMNIIGDKVKVKSESAKVELSIEEGQEMKREKKEDRNNRRHWVSVFRDIFVLTAVKTQDW